MAKNFKIIALLCVFATANALTICEKFGSAVAADRFVVMNNKWGTDEEQCIELWDRGFKILSQNGQGTPASYPAIFYGCHYDNCSPGTNLPKRLSDIGSATSRIGYNLVSGATYNAAYDIWLDPQPNISGVNKQEIMIWLHTEGANVQPIGSYVNDVNFAGHNWAVWIGSNGKNNVISYKSYSSIPALDFNLLEFINDGKNRGLYDNSYYLTSVQAGFEPWVGGAGLAIYDYEVTIN